MSLKFKFIPLTFLKDEAQIKHQIKNTIILRYLFDKFNTTTKLKHLISGTQYGYNASALKSGNNKFLRISDITDGKVNWNDVPFCDCKDEKTYLLQDNDLLIARTGGTTGKSFLISNPPDNAIYAGYLIRIQTNDQNNPEFINLFLNSYIYWSQIVSLNKGEFRPSVNAEKLKTLIIPKVSVEIQNDVVRISKGDKLKGYEDLLSSIDNALSDYEKTIVIKSQIEIQKYYSKNIKQSILQEATQGKLTENWRNENPDVEPGLHLLKRIKAKKEQLIKEKKIKKEKELSSISKEEIPFEIPHNWEWCRLGDVTEYVQRGKSPKYVDSSSIPVISQKCVQWNKFEFHKARFIDEQTIGNYEEERFLKNGDLLWNSTGDGTVGRIIEFFNDTKYDKIVADSHVAVIRPMSSITSSYILFHLSSKWIQDNLIVSGSTKQTELSRSTVLNTIIPLPPLYEQLAIVEKVKILMSKCSLLEQEIAQSHQYVNILMQAVLKEAFESKIVKEDKAQMDRSLQLALMQMMFKQNLGINYGEVIMQKTAYNVDYFLHKDLSFFPYAFQNSNHGAFSVQLREEIESNPYLATKSTDKGKVICVEPQYNSILLDAFSNPVYKDYIRSLTQLLEIYSLPLIGKKSDQIELFNTVLKIMNDLNITDIDTIYSSMENWEIEQKGFKTKAEKFSKLETQRILELILKLR